MGFLQASSISLFLISLPCFCLCQTSDMAKSDERTQINLNDQAGQIALLVGAIIIIDALLTVFAFGYLNQETTKKYKRKGLRSHYRVQKGPNVFRRRPSPLAIALRKKLQRAFTPRKPLYKHYGKRSPEVDIERQDVFRPDLEYDFNDDQIQQSIDLVDTTFGVMNVESEPCRQRTICEMEKVASQSPVVSFVLKTVGPFVKGLEKYDDAAQRGRNGEDCALYYEECQYSLDKLPKFF